MPLTPLQRRVVEVLQPFRTNHDYVAGGVALNQDWTRLSDDLDIFHDQHGRLPDQVDPEVAALRKNGFTVEITTSDEWMLEAIVRQYGFETRVQWLSDPETVCRFFPAVDDDELGFRIHQADAAVNKVLCASSRRQTRDAVDIAMIAQRYAPLGPLIWAAAGKNTATTPIRIAQKIRDNIFGFADVEVRAVRLENDGTMSRDELRGVVGPALKAATNYCEQTAPIDLAGYLFVDSSDIPVEADEAALKNETAVAMPLKKFAPSPKIYDS